MVQRTRSPLIKLGMLLAFGVAVGAGQSVSAQTDHDTSAQPMVKLSDTLSARFVTHGPTSANTRPLDIVMDRLPQVEYAPTGSHAQAVDASATAVIVVSTSPGTKVHKKSHKKRYKKRVTRSYAPKRYRHTHHRIPRHASSWHKNPRRGGSFNAH